MRGKQAPQRAIEPDPRYQSVLLAKFINHVMLDGEKSVAQKVVYGAMDRIKDKIEKDPLSVFEKAIETIEPRLEVVSRRVGGANYQVPRQVRGTRRHFLAMKWIIEAARAQKGRPMADRLADELLNASKNEGVAATKRENVRRMAEANRAFAHLAW